jgi:hypothetical protein
MAFKLHVLAHVPVTRINLPYAHTEKFPVPRPNWAAIEEEEEERRFLVEEKIGLAKL